MEEENKLVQEGVPFREAYQQVAEEIDDGSFSPDKQLSHTHKGSIGNLCNAEISEKFKAAFDFED